MSQFWAVDSVNEPDVTRMENRVAHDGTRAQYYGGSLVATRIIVLAEDLMLAKNIRFVCDT